MHAGLFGNRLEWIVFGTYAILKKNMIAIINIIIRVLVFLGIVTIASVGAYKVLPEYITLKVPFTSQAPEGSWAEPWQNACEEASIIMIDNFYKSDTLTKEKSRVEILSIFNIKERHFGPSADESMETVAAIINSSNLNWRARVIDNPTIEDLKKELADQRPIIVPVDAKMLDNPNYSDPAPDYHVVVLIGYDDATSEFITHDPGTAKGQSFRYDYQKFFDAIGDYLSAGDQRVASKRVLFTMLKRTE